MFLKGVVSSYPQKTDNNIIFEIEKIKILSHNQWQKRKGKIKVIAKNENLFYGDVVQLKGKLNIRRERLTKRIIIFMKPKEILKNGHITLNPIKYLTYKIRKKADLILEKLYPSQYSKFLKAILLGERKQIKWQMQKKFIKSGSAHILAISGLHVGIIGFLIYFILKAIHIYGRRRIIITMIFLIFYMIFTGSRIPVVRATLMTLLYLTAKYLYRDVNLYNLVSFSGLIILLFDPFSIYEISFQLSFIAVLGIVYFFTLFPTRKFEMTRKLDWLKLKTIQGLKASCGAWLGVVPLTWHYWHYISLYSILTNLIIIPLIGIIIAQGFLVILTGLINIKIASIFAFSSYPFLSLLFFLISKISNFPFSYLRMSTISSITILIYYISIIFSLYLIRKFGSFIFFVRLKEPDYSD
jgi:competence protein ComEC